MIVLQIFAGSICGERIYLHPSQRNTLLTAFQKQEKCAASGSEITYPPVFTNGDEIAEGKAVTTQGKNTLRPAQHIRSQIFFVHTGHAPLEKSRKVYHNPEAYAIINDNISI